MFSFKKFYDRYNSLPKVGFLGKVQYAVYRFISKRLVANKIIDNAGGLIAMRYEKPPHKAPRRTYKRLASANGFSWSGSSACLDLLAEYSTVTASLGGNLDESAEERRSKNFEFDLVRGPCGIYELEQAFRTKNFFQRDCAIRFFMKACHYYYLNAVSFYDDEFLKVTREFVLRLIDSQIPSPTGLDFAKPFGEIGTLSANIVLGHDRNDRWEYVYNLKDLSIDEYRKLARDYIHKVLSLSESNELLVLDQGNVDGSADIERFREYFGGIKMIYMWRDPRDIFTVANEGRIDEGNIPSNPEEFARWYLRGVGRFKDINDNDVLLVRLEDLIMKYDVTVQKIEQFLGLNSNDHVLKKRFFVPSRSYEWGTGRWRQYYDQGAIRKIEALLPEYCYKGDYIRPEGPGLSSEEYNRLRWHGGTKEAAEEMIKGLKQ